MEFVEAKSTIWKQENPVNHIARCARVCYASENKTNNENFVKNLERNKHYSMFRHVGVYYIIPARLDINPKAFIDAKIKLVGHKYYVSVNAQAATEYWDNKFAKYGISTEEAFKNDIFRRYKLLRYTFYIETGIDITREFNRKSPNNIAEQSTRYVDFCKKLGIQFKKCHWMYNLNIYKRFLVNIMAKTIEIFYKISRSKYGLNLPPQDARWILALDTMSRVAYTYTVEEWEYIINLRLFDWTGVAHSDAKIVAKQIKKQLEDEGYVIRNFKEIK